MKEEATIMISTILTIGETATMNKAISIDEETTMMTSQPELRETAATT